MKKFFRVLVLVFGLILFVSISFYFWGSSGWVDETTYNQVITYSEKTSSKDTLSVMTYNLGYLSGMTNNLPLDRPNELFKSNLLRALFLIENESPDIIGFQEIDFDSDRSKNYNQLDSFGISQNYHQGFASVNWDKKYVPFPYWPPSLHFGRVLSGQAILSKFPINNTESIILERPSEVPFYYRAFYLDRLVQLTDIQIGSTVVKVMNVHMEAFYPETRRKQADTVKALFEKYASKMPVIFIGDFNSEAPWVEGADEVMRTILSADHLVSAIDQAQYELSLENSHTFSSAKPKKMIDFILYNANYIEKVDAHVVGAAGEISDHFPVMMTFVFK